MKPALLLPSRGKPRGSERGSVLIMALLISIVLVSLAGVGFLNLQKKNRAFYQTASWQEALLAAESGVDIAVSEVRKQLIPGQTAWSGWVVTGTNPNPLGTGTFQSVHREYRTTNIIRPGNRGGQSAWATVEVDEIYPSDAEDPWYRVRARGYCTIPGGGYVAAEPEDYKLRRLELRADHLSGTSVPTPRAWRKIEAVIKPIGVFNLALFGVNTIDLTNQNIVVDSYDSSDPNLSTNGRYDPNKQSDNGNIATDGQLIDAGNAHVYGDASTNGGSVLNSSNVTGEIYDSFYQDVYAVAEPDPSNPLGSTQAGTPTTITSGMNLVPGTTNVYRVDQVRLSGNNVLRLTGSVQYTIVVAGDVSLSGNASIQIDPGASLRLFVYGSADITGNGIQNIGGLPKAAQVYGIWDPKAPSGSTPQIKIAGNGGFAGTVYAPGHSVEILGGGNSSVDVSGAFVGKSVKMNGVQQMHYDESLANSGLISDYKVASWYEDQEDH